MNLSEKILTFFQGLEDYPDVPDGVGVMNPYTRKEVKEITRTFYEKYYGDQQERRMIIGINPGRLGAGLTGIPFTDPIRLNEVCGIANEFDPKPELSSKFVYALIDRMGGPKAFYDRYYISSVSALGFVKDGKNLNYYDIRALQEGWKDYMAGQLADQISFGIDTKKAFVLGMGKNIKFLKGLNEEYKLFDELIPLPHPRWVMQYRLKRLDEFLDEFVQVLG